MTPPSTLTIQLLFFSVLKDITGTAETSWSIASESTLADLLQQLFTRWPALQEWDRSLLLAINQQYSTRESIIPPNAEIAIMPPVQGG